MPDCQHSNTMFPCCYVIRSCPQGPFGSGPKIMEVFCIDVLLQYMKRELNKLLFSSLIIIINSQLCYLPRIINHSKQRADFQRTESIYMQVSDDLLLLLLPTIAIYYIICYSTRQIHLAFRNFARQPPLYYAFPRAFFW